MRKVAAVFTWLGAIAYTISGLIYLIRGIVVTTLKYNPYQGYYYETERIPSPAWLWIVFIIALIIRIVVLSTRESSIDNGKKVSAGVLTLIFVSVIGGILTLCIPEERHYNSNPSYTYTSTSTYSAPQHFTEHEVKKRIEVNKELLDKGIITQDEYDKRVSEIKSKGPIKQVVIVQSNEGDSQEDNSNIIPSEEAIIQTIQRYQQLLNSGIITQEEFEKKKAELLK